MTEVLFMLHDIHIPHRPLWPAVWRGLTHCCPRCGSGRLFNGYCTVQPRCSVCGEELHHHRAREMSVYLTIFIVGHLLVPLILFAEAIWQLEVATHAAVWLPAGAILTLALLPSVKGAILGLQWALYMHGFATAATSAGDHLMARTERR